MSLYDVLFNIAEFIEPDIATYCRLSSVNREFYSVFTSDRVWKPLNAYGVDTDVFESFKRALDIPASRELLKLLTTRGNCSLKPKVLIKLTENRFIWLQYLANQGPIGPFLEMNHIIECVTHSLLHREFIYSRHASRIIGRISDRSRAIEIVSARGVLLEYLPEYLRADYEVVLAAVRSRGILDGTVSVIEHATQELRHDAVIGTSALKTDGRSIEYVSQHVVHMLATNLVQAVEVAYEHPKALRSISEVCEVDFMVQVLEAIEFSPYANEFTLDGFPSKFQESYEICTRALVLNPKVLSCCRCIDKRLIVQFLNLVQRNAKQDSSRDHLGGTVGLRMYLDFVASQDAKHPGKCEILNDYEFCEFLMDARRDSYRYFPQHFCKKHELAERLCADPEDMSLLTRPLKRDAGFLVQMIDKYAGKWQNMETDWTWRRLPLLKNARVREAVADSGLATRIEVENFVNNVGFGSKNASAETSAPTFLEEDHTSSNTHSEDVNPYPGPKLRRDLPYDEKIKFLESSDCGSYETRLQSDNKKMLTAMFTPTPWGRVCFPYDCVAPELKADKKFMMSLFELCGLAPAGSIPACELLLLNRIAFNECSYSEASNEQKRRLEFNISAAKKNANSLVCMDQDMRTDSRVLETAGSEQMQSSCDKCALENPDVFFTRTLLETLEELERMEEED